MSVLDVDLLAPNNACGQQLLRLVSRGNTIVAELLRLADRVPAVYLRPPTADHQTLLLDFAYFQQVEHFEMLIDDNDALLDLDASIRDTYLPVVNKFYLCFESIHSYIIELSKFIDDVEEGAYLQQNLEGLFMHPDGKQLLCESLYVYGVMLLVLDSRLHGLTRERLLVSYYRYSSRRTALQSDIDDICALLRSTGYEPNEAVRPQYYPEKYFSRVAISSTFISLVIGRLRVDDLYNQLQSFPLLEHRGTALAGQAAMLYVCLYFKPEILHTQTATMRELVDRFWPDSWTTSVYLGITVNLIQAWEPYKAARTALANTLDTDNVAALATHHGKEMRVIETGLSNVLQEGVLQKQYVMTNLTKLMNSLRKANVTLRWLIMHSTAWPPESLGHKRCEQVRAQVMQYGNIQSTNVFNLLLCTAQFEHKLKEMFKHLLSERSVVCERLRRDVAERFAELIDVFSGTKPLTRVKKSEKLQKWFSALKDQMTNMDFVNALDESGRKLVHICTRLNEVRDLHSLDTHVGVRQFLDEIHQLLHELLRALNIKDSTLYQLHTVGDFAYAWHIVDLYTERMQEGIKQQPDMAIRLKATFLKLSTGFDMPLLRIQQANNTQVLASVSQFYSTQLVQYMRKVLQVIPSTVFSMLQQIVELQHSSIAELPAKLPADKFKEYAHVNERYQMARLTHGISLLTEGLLAMKTTLVGMIRVQPRAVLEDGIRRELVLRATRTLHKTLVFVGHTDHNQVSAKTSLAAKLRQSGAPSQEGHAGHSKVTDDVYERLQMVASQMDAYRRSFAYIADYMSLCALKIWQQEITRIIGYAVELECNVYLPVKVTDDDSMYQSQLVPIPCYAVDASDTASVTFIGRLLTRIMHHTDTLSTVYYTPTSTWYSLKTKQELLGPDLFQLLLKALSPHGVNGLSRLCGFAVADRLQRAHHLLHASRTQTVLSVIHQVLTSTNTTFQQANKVYEALVVKWHVKDVQPFMNVLGKVGQLQLVRSALIGQLSHSAKFQSQLLYQSLTTLNQSMLHDFSKRATEAATVDSADKQQQQEESRLLYELGAYLQAVGITDCTKKRYISVSGNQSSSAGLLSDLLFMVMLHSLNVYVLDGQRGLCRSVAASKGLDTVDPPVLLLGVSTVLRQHPYEHTHTLLHYLAQYIMSFLQCNYHTLSTNAKRVDLPSKVSVMVSIFQQLGVLTDTPQTDLHALVPEALLNQYEVFGK